MNDHSSGINEKMGGADSKLGLWFGAGFIGMVLFFLGAYFTDNTGAGEAFIYGIVPSLVGLVCLMPGQSKRFALLALAFPVGLILFLATDASVYLKLGLFPVFFLSPLVHFRSSVPKWSYLLGILCVLGAGLTTHPSIFMEDYITVRMGHYFSYGFFGVGLMIFAAFFTNPNLGGNKAKSVGLGAGSLAFLGVFSLLTSWLVPSVAGLALGMTKFAAGAIFLVVVFHTLQYYYARVLVAAGQSAAQQGEAGMVRGSKVDR